MSHAVAEPFLEISFEDYLTIDTGEGRLEWVAGRVHAMSGGTERHNLIISEISDVLRDGARARGCRRFIQGRRLRTDTASYYPDVFIVSGPAGADQYETDASLVVEVPSPSTQDVDRREKPISYRRLPSFERYLIVDPDRMHIEVGEPGEGMLRWTAYGPGDTVVTPYGNLVLDELYGAVDEVATRKTR